MTKIFLKWPPFHSLQVPEWDICLLSMVVKVRDKLKDTGTWTYTQRDSHMGRCWDEGKFVWKWDSKLCNELQFLQFHFRLHREISEALRGAGRTGMEGSEWIRKVYQAILKQKKAAVAMLISDNRGFSLLICFLNGLQVHRIWLIIILVSFHRYLLTFD